MINGIKPLPPKQDFDSAIDKLVLGIETSIPWEFSKKNALRSILPPLVSTGLPIYFGNKIGFSGVYLYLFPFGRIEISMTV